MAELSTNARAQVWRGIMRYISSQRLPCEVTKFQLYNPANNTGAIADVDAWIDSRVGLTAPDTVGFNGAINASYRAGISADIKALIFIAVAAARRGPEFVRSIFGEID